MSIISSIFVFCLSFLSQHKRNEALYLPTCHVSHLTELLLFLFFKRWLIRNCRWNNMNDSGWFPFCPWHSSFIRRVRQIVRMRKLKLTTSSWPIGGFCGQSQTTYECVFLTFPPLNNMPPSESKLSKVMQKKKFFLLITTKTEICSQSITHNNIL